MLRYLSKKAVEVTQIYNILIESDYHFTILPAQANKKIVNYEFVAKRNGRRVRIPSKFEEIDIDSQVLYAISGYDNQRLELSKPKIGTVQKRRYLAFEEEISDKDVYVIIHQILLPVEFHIGETFHIRINSKGHMRIPKILGLKPHDRIIGEIKGKLGDPSIEISRTFESKISKTETFYIPLETNEFSSRDRFQVYLEKAIISPHNFMYFGKKDYDLPIGWIFGLYQTEFELICTSSISEEEHIEVLKQILTQNDISNLDVVLLSKNNHTYFVVIDTSSQPKNKGLFRISCYINTSHEFSLYPFLDHIRLFHLNEITPISIDLWSRRTLSRKYQNFRRFMLDHNHMKVDFREYSSFLPEDIFDQTKYSQEEATVLSFILSRIVNNDMFTPLQLLKEHLHLDNLDKIVQGLKERYALVEKFESNERGFSLPLFFIPSFQREISSVDALSIIIHSFGGGTAKTTLSCNLSSYFAKHNLRTALIDYDFINTRLFTIFDTLLDHNDIIYLNEYLEGHKNVNEIINQTTIKNLDVILANPSSVLTSIKNPDPTNNMSYFRKMVIMLKELKSNYDVILFDAEGTVDFNTLNAFLLTDISLILSNGNKSSLGGLRHRAELILKRSGINIRNDYLIQTLVPLTRKEQAMSRIGSWREEFEKLGIMVYPDPLFDEFEVKEMIYDDQYFIHENTHFWSWIEKLVETLPRLQKWEKLRAALS